MKKLCRNILLRSKVTFASQPFLANDQRQTKIRLEPVRQDSERRKK
ncbi:TPA: hypothetical protein ACGO3U_000778 [Streptococcus suis]